MKLSEVYDIYSSSGFDILHHGSIENSKYPKNIILHFNGIAYVRVYIDEVLIEEGLSEDKYILSNFRNVPYPYEIYPKLSFDVDLPYSISYVETNVHYLSKQCLTHKTVTYRLTNNSYRGILIFKHGTITYKSAHERKKEDIDNDYFPIESFNWKEITESVTYEKLACSIMFMYGVPYNLYILEKFGVCCKPCLLVKRKNVSRFLDILKSQYPGTTFYISNEKPNVLIKRHKMYIDYILSLYRKKDNDTTRNSTHTPIDYNLLN